MDRNDRCLNCERTEAEVPLSTWRFQERELVICAECLPILIHQRAKLMAKWEAQASRSENT